MIRSTFGWSRNSQRGIFEHLMKAVIYKIEFTICTKAMFLIFRHNVIKFCEKWGESRKRVTGIPK